MKTTQLIIGLILFAQSLTAWSFNLAPQPLPFAAPNVAFTTQATQKSLADYKGKQVMLWLFSTWCHTCVASVKAMQKQHAILKEKGLIILAIRNYNNGGYPGVMMPAFMKKFAPQIKELSNWVVGEASKEMDEKLNAKKFPDIYFLIDKKGMVQVVDTAPNRTMKHILKFANGNQQ